MKTSKFVLFLVLLSGVYFLFGAEYGTITGKVINSETGEPLIGADIIIETTELGVATDETGVYTITNVPIGIYRVVAAYIGYDPYTYTNVVVNINQPTLLNFRLRPTVIQILHRHWLPRIHLYETQSISKIQTKNIARLPIMTIEEVLKLQPGIVQTDSGIHMRGGKHDEIKYYVDGIETMVPNFGWQSTHINPDAVQQISIINGGFNAEYGDALSGIVNIITKQGRTKHHVNFHYRTDELFTGDKLNFGYNRYSLSLGGPIARRFRYFISGNLMLTDAYKEALYKVSSPRNDYQTQARIIYLVPNARGKITISAFKSREQFVMWKPPYKENQSALTYFLDKPMSRSKNWIVSAAFDYLLTPRTLTSIKIGFTHFDRVFGSRDYEWEQENERKWYDDYRFKNEHLIEYLLSDTISFPWILMDSMIYYDAENSDPFRQDPYGVNGIFNYITDYPVWSFWYNNDFQVKADITQSQGRHHEIKAGFDFIKYDVRYFNRTAPFTSYTYPDLGYYKRRPYKLAGYLQDKIDFAGIIAKIGIRFDYFDANTFTYINPYDFLDDTLISSDPIYSISPRFGFSLPVTDRMKFRFNYGHYYQIPAFDYMYNTSDTTVIRLLLLYGDSILSNILLEPEKMVAYEFGFEKIFSWNMLFSITAFCKDFENLVQLQRVQALPTYFYQYFNDAHHNVKGVEIIIKKSMSNMWGLGIAYTLQFANGTSSWASERYYKSDIVPPAINYPLHFDERHNIVANFDLETPGDFFLSPLQNFVSSFVFSYHAGHPYTPEDLDGNRLGNVNSVRMSGFWNIDWKISRQIKLGPTKFILTSLINNLFNTNQVIKVYSTTGKPDEHGDTEPLISQFHYVPMTSMYYSPQADSDHDGLITPGEMKNAYMTALNDYYSDPTNYNSGFRMRLGIGIEF
ncbi:TonB-dependent receptor [candidate division WOR-3 bacterium]|nr:TonB-dependent receptor [candidate division WOR-3 bacterium]